MTKAEFMQLAMLIKGLYPRDEKLFSDRSQVDIWYAMVSDLEYADALIAIQKHAQTNAFPPSIADIRGGSESDTDWTDAYEDAIRIISRYGTYRRQQGLAAMDEMTRAIVDRIGYDRIALSPEHDQQIKREFKDTYSRIADKKKREQLISIQQSSETGELPCLM